MNNIEQKTELFAPPDVEKLMLEMVQLDKAISGARDDSERLRLLSAAYLKDKRQSIHLQIAMYQHYKNSEQKQDEMLTMIQGFRSDLKPLLTAFSDSKTVRAYTIMFAKGIIFTSAVVGAIIALVTAIKHGLK